MRERLIVRLMVLLLLCSIVVGLSQAFRRPGIDLDLAIPADGRNGIAVVTLYGPIYGPEEQTRYGASGIDRVVSDLDWAANHRGVKAVVLRINSPGGSVGATQELHDAVVRFKETGKPLVVSVPEVCASTQT